MHHPLEYMRGCRCIMKKDDANRSSFHTGALLDLTLALWSGSRMKIHGEKGMCTTVLFPKCIVLLCTVLSRQLSETYVI